MTTIEEVASTPSRQAIEETLMACLDEVLGPDILEVMNVDGQTRVFTDIGLSSIDIVRVAELIVKHYPAADQLVMWVADRPPTEIVRITVDDIVGYIADVCR